MNSRLRVLHLEDDSVDAELVQNTLVTGGIECEITRVETACDFRSALRRGKFELLLADYTLPSLDGLSALSIAHQQQPELPFIFVSGTLGEEVAIEALKIGATDYVLKTRLSRLVPSVQRALREAKEKAERKRAEELAHGSEAKFRQLVDSNIVGISIWDLDGRVLEANDAFLCIVGYERDDVLSGRLRWTEFAPSQGPGRGRQEMLAHLQSGAGSVLVADLCALLELSEAHFSRAFKRTFGESPHAFLIRRRVELAAQYMLQSEARLSDIAQSCGFTDLPHLCKQFRHMTGHTPAAWRRAHKREDKTDGHRAVAGFLSERSPQSSMSAHAMPVEGEVS
jgi:AraC-like DNA-binding protein